MIEWLESITAAQWLIAGLLLMILEVFVPGAFLIWFGLAALLVGVLAWLLPALPWQAEVLLFALLSIGTVLGYRSWRKRVPAPASQEPLLNRRAQQFVGRIFALEQSIENGRGKIKVGDALWTVSGPELPSGSRIRVIGTKDQILEVVAAD